MCRALPTPGILEAQEDQYALQLLVTDSIAPEDNNFRGRVWLPFDRAVLGARAAAAIREVLLGQRAQGQPWAIVAQQDSLQAPKLSTFHVRMGNKIGRKILLTTALAW